MEQYTGLRPGEKLYEELLTAEEGVAATQHKQIMMARQNHHRAIALASCLSELRELCAAGKGFDVLALEHLLIHKALDEVAAGVEGGHHVQVS